MSKVVCLDAGHGGKDSGAVGNLLKEKDINLKMVNKIGNLLNKQGIEVVYTRTTDVFVTLADRCKIANNKKCDAFVSLHTNSATNPTANGIETLCYTKNNLANYIQSELINTLKLTNRNVKERKDLYVLNSTNMIAVLIELGFISNNNDAALMKQDSFLNKSAECIVKGICKYLGIEFKGGNVVSSNTNTNNTSTNQTVSSWAKEAWEWAKKEGLIDGTRPKDNLTREELATVLFRMSKKV